MATGRADGSIIIDTRVDTRGMTTGLDRCRNKVEGLGSSFKKLGAIIATVFAVKKIIDFSKECIELGSSLAEVQNVVDVTFGKSSAAVEKFAKEAATAYGLSELSAKQYTSTIGAMLKSMGFAEDAAADMSIQMAGLAGDMASFYNLDTDAAFQKIRSGISGETEPLKQLGINLSEANLEQFRLNQGMATAYKNMSQQEKALLRYNYLLSVTSDAQGDFARTSASWANQTRILSLQLQSIKAELGQGLINVLTPALQIINKMLAALARLASAFRAFTELITGKKAQAGNGTSAGAVEDTATAYDSAEESASNYADAQQDVAKATKAAKKETDRYMSSLDEIHRFDAKDEAASALPTTTTGKTSTPAAAAGSGLPDVNFGKLAEGETVVDKLALKMKALYDAIMKGAQPAADALKRLWEGGLSRLGKFSWNALLGFYEHFLVPVGSWVMGTGIPRFIDALNEGLLAINWDRINDALNGLWDALAPFAINVGEGLLWFWENVLVPLGTWVMNEAVPRFLTTLALLIGIANAILKAAQPAFNWFWENILEPIAKFVGDKFLQFWDWLNEKLSAFSQWCKDNPETIAAITQVVADFFAAWAIVTLIGKIIGLIGTIGALVSSIGTLAGAFNPVILAIIAAVAAGIWIWQNWDWLSQKAVEVASNIRDWFVEKWNNLTEEVTTFAGNMRDKVVSGWLYLWNAATALGKNVYTAIADKFEALKTTAETIWNNLKTKVVEIWLGLWNGAKEVGKNIYEAVHDKFVALRKIVPGIWRAIKNTVVNIFSVAKNKVVEFAGKIKDGLVGAFEGVVKLIKVPINAVIGFINGMIEGIVNGINAVIDTLNKLSFSLPDWAGGMKFGLDIPRIESYVQIPELARGAVIPPNAPFLATLGDQKRGQNIETPEGLLRQIMREERGGGDITLKVYLDGREVYNSVIRRGQQEQFATGVNPFELA